jgi:hypothetical protein
MDNIPNFKTFSMEELKAQGVNLQERSMGGNRPSQEELYANIDNPMVQPKVMGNLMPNGPLQLEMPQQQEIMEQSGREVDNPFNSERYNDLAMPDTPVGFGGGMAEQLLNDNEVPKEIRKEHWWVFHKDNTLTFLDPERKASKLLNFDIAKIDMLNSMPYYDYTLEKEMEFGILRNTFETKLDRALGAKNGNVKNERVMLQSQFSENRQIHDDGANANIKEGFFKRLLGRR